MQLLQGLVDGGEGFFAGFGILQGAADVDLHDLLAGAAKDFFNYRQVQFAAADDGVKVQFDVGLEIHLALAQQADGVAVEIDAVEIDVLAFDAVIHRAGAEGVAVGRGGC